MNYEVEGEPSISATLRGRDAQCFWLRRRLECLEASRNGFVNFARSQGLAKWLKGKTRRSQDARLRRILVAAGAKDTEVRDYLQLPIGNLSILDSRKTIQLSNQQIDEAKRGTHSRSPKISHKR